MKANNVHENILVTKNRQYISAVSVSNNTGNLYTTQVEKPFQLGLINHSYITPSSVTDNVQAAW